MRGRARRAGATRTAATGDRALRGRAGVARGRTARLVATLALAPALAFVGACSASGDTEQSSGPTRAVTHAMGTTQVPERPQRVVVLDTPELDAAVTLGVTPVGTVRDEASAGPSAYLGEKAANIPVVGIIGTPNLEEISRLRPDLILSSKDRDEPRYQQLSQIAPTVFGEAPGANWKQNFLLYSDALGKAAEGRAALDAYQNRAKQVGQQVGDPASKTVSVVRFLTDETRLYTPGSFSGIILADVGVARPAIVQNAEDIAVNISPEELPKADADFVYAAYYAPKEMTTFPQGQALWAQLGAVREGRAFDVDDKIWMTGIGVTGAGLVLDDLQRTLKG